MKFPLPTILSKYRNFNIHYLLVCRQFVDLTSMLEGQEVKMVAGRISSLVKGKEIVNILLKKMDISMKNRIMSSRLYENRNISNKPCI